MAPVESIDGLYEQHHSANASQFSSRTGVSRAINIQKPVARTVDECGNHQRLFVASLFECQIEKEKETARRQSGRSVARSRQNSSPRSLLWTGAKGAVSSRALSFRKR